MWSRVAIPFIVCFILFIKLKGIMPTMITSNKNGFCLIAELVSCEIDNDVALEKPSVRMSLTTTKYILKLAATILFKILSKKQGGIAAGTPWEIVQGSNQRFRVTLYNGSSEFGCKSFQFIYVTVCHKHGEIYTTRSRPLGVQELLKEADDGRKQWDKLEMFLRRAFPAEIESRNPKNFSDCVDVVIELLSKGHGN